MKLSSDRWRVHWNDDTIFYSYRWLAWALAGLALAVPEATAASLPRDAGLLLLLGVISVAATAMAQGYVRLARRRPFVMLLDGLASLTVVWLSGGGVLPFLPYALGALVLPALLNGWAGALIAGVAFASLDILGLLLLALLPDTNALMLSLGLHAAIPLAFAAAWVLLGYALRSGSRSRPINDQWLPISSPDQVAGAAPGDLVQLDTLKINPSPKVTASRAGRPPSTPSPVESIPRTEAARPVIFDAALGESISFPAAIEHLALTLSHQGGVEMRLTTLGSVRSLTGAQQSVLLRVAQEALLNVQQHSHAHTVLVTLTYEPQAVTLAVQDDGVGLLDGTYERPGMHALRAIRYRLAELEGQLAVFESESGGVTLRATLPLD